MLAQLGLLMMLQLIGEALATSLTVPPTVRPSICE